MKRNFYFGISTVGLFLIFFSCSKELPLEATYPTFKQYLFIEQYKYSYGELIEGDTVALLQIDFPTYGFSEELGELGSKFINFDINNKLKAIIGRGEGLGGMAGGGSATGLIGRYEIPSEKNKFNLLEINKDESIRLIYEDSIFLSLKKGESWIKKFEKTDVQEHAKIKLTITDKIKNYGFQYKSGINRN